MKVCTKCGVMKAWADFNHDAGRSDGHQYWCRVCKKSWHHGHIAQTKQTKAAWRKANRECERAQNAAWNAANKGHLKELFANWGRANPGKVNAKHAKYRAAKLQATPSWVDRKEIEKIYVDAAAKGLTVDHKTPLQGKTVSGLHVPWNLQLLTGSENSKKGNRFE